VSELIHVDSDSGQWFIDLVRAETRMYGAVDARLRAEHGLSAGQFEILQLIDGIENCRVLDIVRDVAISVGAASKAVDRVEAAGWCRRTANPHDRRSSYLKLTPAGRRMLDAARPTFAAETAERLSVLSEADRATAGRALATLRRALEDRQRTPEE
jgi:DNA-binding MarR family transcriptional regulator